MKFVNTLAHAMTRTHTTTPQAFSLSAAVFAAVLMFTVSAQAVDYTWDPTSGDGVVTEGTGTWDTTTTNWTTDVGVTNVAAPSGAFTSDLIFGGGTLGTAGTVTLATTGNDYGSIEFLATNAGTYDIDLNGKLKVRTDRGVTLHFQTPDNFESAPYAEVVAAMRAAAVLAANAVAARTAADVNMSIGTQGQQLVAAGGAGMGSGVTYEQALSRTLKSRPFTMVSTIHRTHHHKICTPHTPYTREY